MGPPAAAESGIGGSSVPAHGSALDAASSLTGAGWPFRVGSSSSKWSLAWTGIGLVACPLGGAQESGPRGEPGAVGVGRLSAEVDVKGLDMNNETAEQEQEGDHATQQQPGEGGADL